MENRKQILKELILSLHDGKPFEEVRSRFIKEFGSVSSMEIARTEQELIADGLPIEEVQRLCDVHSSIFEGAIVNEETEKPDIFVEQSFMDITDENARISQKLDTLMDAAQSFDNTGETAALSAALADFDVLDVHYKKKENILFPYLEKHGITSPPKVMWGVDDEIRVQIKSIAAQLDGGNKADISAAIKTLTAKINDMIFKEENILFPMMSETLSADEWKAIFPQLKNFNKNSAVASHYYENQSKYTENLVQAAENDNAKQSAAKNPEFINLPSGKFKLDELVNMLNALPFDITFVDKDDRVAYFTEGKERIFPRERAAIGREVANCHPPKSVHIVEKIMDSFKDGTKDHEDFWIKMKGVYVFIRYFAVRNEKGEYLGTLEVTQNIAPIKEIEGEKRLMD